METEFFTIDSKLTLKNNVIWENRILQQPPSYWFHSFVLLVIMLGYTIYEINAGERHEWLFGLLVIWWLSPHLKRIYQLLFVKVWRWYVPLAEVKTVYYEKEYNEFEERVRIVLKSGREKIYIFRKSEQQASRFVEFVSNQAESPFFAVQ